MYNMSVVEVIKHYQRSIEKCSGNQERMLHCISKLYRLPVTVQHLQDTGVGRTVNALRKYEGDTGEAAKALVAKWKAMVAAEDSTDDEERQEDGKDVGKEEEQVQKHHKSHKDKVSHRERSSSKSHREEEKPRSHEDKSSKSSSHDHQSKKRKYEEENGKATEKRRKKQEVESDSSEQEDTVETAEQDEDDDDDGEDSDRDSEARSTSQTSQNMDSSDSEASPPPRVRDREKHNSHRKHKDRSSSKDRTLSRREQHSRKEDSRQKEEHSRKEDHSRKEEHSRKEDHSRKEEHSRKEDYSRKEEHCRKEDHSRKEEHNRKEDHSRKEEHNRKEDHSRKEEHSRKENHSRKEEHSRKEDHSRKVDSRQKEEHSRKRKEEHNQREERKGKGENSRKETASLKEDSHKVKVKTEPKQKSTSGSHSNIPESPSKSKEKVKVKKERTEDGVGVDGIDCSTGASFAEALGMVDPVAKKKPYSSPGTSSNCSTPRSSNKTRAESVTPKKKERSVPSSPADLGLLSPNVKLEPLNEVEVDLNATLPAITPNYKPLPHYNRLDSPPHRKTVHLTEEEALCQVMSTKNKRTKVFSGGKSKVRVQVPSLYDICVRVLQENIEALEYTGGVPYDLLKPVLLHVTAEQLFALEHHNPYLIEDTDELWQFHCQREFRTKQRQDMETAREMYLRCLDEREAKLKALTSNIQQSIANSTPVRQTKLAYVDSVAKPPRNVARQQAKYGTARANTKPTPVTKAARPSGTAATSAAVSVPAPRTIHTAAKAKPRMAPLMQKTMKLVKSFNKR